MRSSARADLPVAWYAVALVSYVLLGYLTKTVVLNWVVGPLYLVLVLWVLPQGVRALRR